MDYSLLLIIFFGFALSAFLTGRVRQYAIRKNVLDIPNERSSHSIPTPRGGGIAIVFSMLFAFIATVIVNSTFPGSILITLAACCLIALIGWYDDKFSLPARQRLVVQVLSACLITYAAINGNVAAFASLLGLESFEYIGLLVTAVFSLLFIIWMTNLYNFMDGIDGITSSQVISVCLLSLFLFDGPWDSFSVLALLITAAATAGFLLWNWSPAKIFMGDVGSAYLGAWLAGLSLLLHANGILPLPVSIILNGSFIADTTYTLIIRYRGGETVYEAHCSHAYQRASQKFGSHSRITSSVVLINVLWLFPVAIFCSKFISFWPLWMLLAFSPLCALAFYFRAGKPGKDA